MERSFVSLAGVEHEAELLNGYVDLVDSNGDAELKTPEAIYTETVLKLDGDTYGIVDGQEGFLDNIKRGATKVYEWIKSLIRAIKDWLFGKPKQEVAKVEKEFIETAADLDDITSETGKEISEIIRSVMESHIAEPAKLNVKRNLSRVPLEDRKIINETVVGIPGYTEKSEKIVSEMATRMVTRLNSVANNIAEIERIDPDHIISKELGITDFLDTYSKKGVDQSKFLLEISNSGTIKLAAEAIVKVARGFDTALAHATNSLEKMNSKGPFAVENEESRQVARAGSIVKELAESTNKMRDLVTTLDSQLLKTAAQMESTALKNRITEAMKYTSEASGEYLQKALDEL